MPILLYVILFCTSLLLGIVASYFHLQPPYRRGLQAGLASMQRLLAKTIRRLREPGIDPIVQKKDYQFSTLPTSRKKQQADQTAILISEDLKNILATRYGDRLSCLLLFGSRARGDHDRHSDVDVAIFFKELDSIRKPVKNDLLLFSHQALIKHGLYFQLRLYDEKLLAEEYASGDFLVHAILRFGIQI